MRKFKFLTYVDDEGSVPGHFIVNGITILFTHNHFVIDPCLKPFQHRANAFS